MSTLLRRGFANRFVLIVMAAALAAGAGLYAAQRYFAAATPTRAAAAAQASGVRLASVRRIDPPRELSDSRLTLSDGSALSSETLRGHWTIVFLGFTHCPDVCPTTLAELSKAQHAWRSIAPATRPRILFVTADPERDTPTVTGQFAHFFSPDTLAASGTLAEVSAFAQALGLVFMKVPLANGDYTMDHSATLVVLAPDGRQAGLIRPPLAWNAIAEDLRRLADGSR